MERTDSWERPTIRWSPVPVLAAYYDAVIVVCELAGQFSDEAWSAPTPCADWRAADLAGHLRCMADDYHEYLDDAPVSRLSRLMATGAHPDALAAQAGQAELGRAGRAAGRQRRRAHCRVRRVGPGVRPQADAGLGPAASPVPGHRGDRGGHGRRCVRRVAPARLGSRQGARQGLPAGRARDRAGGLAGRDAAAAGAAGRRAPMAAAAICGARCSAPPAGRRRGAIRLRVP